MQRVLIVTHCPLARLGLDAALERVDPALARTTVSCAGVRPQECARQASECDMVVVSDCGDREVAEAVITCCREQTGAPLLVVTEQERTEDLSGYVVAGVEGLVLKRHLDRDFAPAVRALLGGGRFVSGELAGALLSPPTTAETAPVAEQAEKPALTRRQSQIVSLTALGYTSREVGARLGISARTAETHRLRAMRKLGLKSRAELVRYAMERGLLDVEAAQAAAVRSDQPCRDANCAYAAQSPLC